MQNTFVNINYFNKYYTLSIYEKLRMIISNYT